MFHDRLAPSGESDGTWWTVTDRASADASVGDVLAVLEGVRGWTLLEHLLERDRFLRYVENGDLGMVRREWGYETYFDLAEIALRIDRGPSPDLTRAVASVRSAGPTSDPDFAAPFEQWLRDEAARL